MRELEFLPDDYIRARFHRHIRFIRSWLLLAMGLAMVLWSVEMGSWVREARADLQALRHAGFAVEGQVEQLHALEAEAEAYEHRLGVVRKLAPRVWATDAMAALADLVPCDVGLDRVWYTDGAEAADRRPRLVVKGCAPNEIEVTQTLAALEGARCFVSARLVESKPVADRAGTWRHFTIEAPVAPRETEED